MDGQGLLLALSAALGNLQTSLHFARWLDNSVCDDGSPEAAHARALALENNFQDPDAYEKLQFYYHPDHLGSNSYITNLDGEVGAAYRVCSVR